MKQYNTTRLNPLKEVLEIMHFEKGFTVDEILLIVMIFYGANPDHKEMALRKIEEAIKVITEHK